MFQSSWSHFADGLLLLFVPYSARYPSSLYSTSNIFHTVTTHALNSSWISSAFKTRPSTQYCETISTVNVTYKLSINLLSLHFNGTLTQSRIKLLPRDQPNHLTPWWNHPPTVRHWGCTNCPFTMSRNTWTTNSVCLCGHTSMHMHTRIEVTLLNVN